MDVQCSAAFGLPHAELPKDIVEKLSVLGQGNALRRCSQDRNPRLCKGSGEVERSLSAELHDNAQGLFGLYNGKDVLCGQGLEIELVRGVIIGAHGLGVAVNHDALDVLFAKAEGCLHAAVIEFNPLADPIRPASQDHDLCFRGDPGFVFVFIGGIVVRSAGLKLGCTGVDKLENRLNTKSITGCADFILIRFHQPCQMTIGKTKGFALPYELVRPSRSCRYSFFLQGNDLLYLVEEPRVDSG